MWRLDAGRRWWGRGRPFIPLGRVTFRPTDEVGCQCNVTVEVVEAATGRLLWRERGHNLTPTAGRNLLRDFLNGDAPAGITHFAVGTGAAAASNNNTALGTEVLRDIVTTKTKDVLKLTVKYFLGTASANGNTLAEAGLFNAAAAGTMYARYVLATAIVKTSSIAVTFTWELSWTVTAVQILERGTVVELGGEADAFVRPSSSDVYPAGATFDQLVPGSTVWFIDAADLQGGTFVLEATAKVEGAGARAKVALFNLDDGSPNAALAGSEITFTAGNTTGERRRSGTITFPSAGAAKQLGVKVTANSTTIGAAAWGCRIVRTG